MKRKHTIARYPLILSSLLLVPSVAQAQETPQPEQGFALNRFNPSERGSEWFSADSLDMRGHLRPALGLTLDWAHKPRSWVNSLRFQTLDAAKFRHSHHNRVGTAYTPIFICLTAGRSCRLATRQRPLVDSLVHATRQHQPALADPSVMRRRSVTTRPVEHWQKADGSHL